MHCGNHTIFGYESQSGRMEIDEKGLNIGLEVVCGVNNF